MSSNNVLFPDVTVKLSQGSGNAFSILARVQGALKDAGEEDAAKSFMQEATSGNYDHLLQTAMKYVNVE